MVYWDMESLRGRCKSNQANDPDHLPGSTTPRNMDKMNRPKYHVKREGTINKYHNNRQSNSNIIKAGEKRQAGCKVLQ